MHNQALKYLQYHTRRCISCGEGRFVKLLGEVSKIEQRKKTITQLDEIFEEDIYEEEEDEKKKSKLNILKIVFNFRSFHLGVIKIC